MTSTTTSDLQTTVAEKTEQLSSLECVFTRPKSAKTSYGTSQQLFLFFTKFTQFKTMADMVGNDGGSGGQGGMTSSESLENLFVGGMSGASGNNWGERGLASGLREGERGEGIGSQVREDGAVSGSHTSGHGGVESGAGNPENASDRAFFDSLQRLAKEGRLQGILNASGWANTPESASQVATTKFLDSIGNLAQNLTSSVTKEKEKEGGMSVIDGTARVSGACPPLAGSVRAALVSQTAEAAPSACVAFALEWLAWDKSHNCVGSCDALRHWRSWGVAYHTKLGGVVAENEADETCGGIVAACQANPHAFLEMAAYSPGFNKTRTPNMSDKVAIDLNLGTTVYATNSVEHILKNFKGKDKLLSFDEWYGAAKVLLRIFREAEDKHEGAAACWERYIDLVEGIYYGEGRGAAENWPVIRDADIRHRNQHTVSGKDLGNGSRAWPDISNVAVFESLYQSVTNRGTLPFSLESCTVPEKRPALSERLHVSLRETSIGGG
ncbi:hypothetical protein BT69DRAFT_1399652 [Atractiella rhizophila]|nr:hypothetical protein BT69DRAFT_1399652 [Atractiella rhizophila]